MVVWLVGMRFYRCTGWCIAIHADFSLGCTITCNRPNSTTRRVSIPWHIVIFQGVDLRSYHMIVDKTTAFSECQVVVLKAAGQSLATGCTDDHHNFIFAAIDNRKRSAGLSIHNRGPSHQHYDPVANWCCAKMVGATTILVLQPEEWVFRNEANTFFAHCTEIVLWIAILVWVCSSHIGKRRKDLIRDLCAVSVSNFSGRRKTWK